MRSSLLFILVAALVVPAACSSGSTGGGSTADGGGDGSTSCSCHVDVNGEAKDIVCGSEACVAGTTYTCGPRASIAMGGTCTSMADAAPPPDSGQRDSGHRDAGPAACDETTCTSDSECQTISASWKCYALDAFNSAKACFPDQLIFPGDMPGDDCLDYSDRTTVQVTCTNGKFAVCVPKTCTKSGEKPATIQSRRC